MSLLLIPPLLLVLVVTLWALSCRWPVGSDVFWTRALTRPPVQYCFLPLLAAGRALVIEILVVAHWC